jgi:hypothetical protein
VWTAPEDESHVDVVKCKPMEIPVKPVKPIEKPRRKCYVSSFAEKVPDKRG